MGDCTQCPLFLLIHTLLSEERQHFYDHHIQSIKESVSIQTGVSLQDLESKSRKQHIVRARKMAMKRCRDIDITFQRIADAFNRSPSTVMYFVS